MAESSITICSNGLGAWHMGYKAPLFHDFSHQIISYKAVVDTHATGVSKL
jgi:hypothetical protein